MFQVNIKFYENKNFNINKTGKQPVSSYGKEVSLLMGLGWDQSPFGAMAKPID